MNSTDSFSFPRPPRKFFWFVWGVALLAGLFGVYSRILYGHLPAGYGSYVPWGLWVALYFHGIGMGGGAFLVGAGGYVFDLPGFRSKRVLRNTIVLSAASIAAGLLGVWFDLGHMERAYFIMLHPSMTSMMAFNAWMYNIFLLIAGICFLLSLKKDDSGWLKPFLSLGMIFSILFPSQSGAFFGVVSGKSFWHNPLLPFIFLVSAVVAGAALLGLMRWMTQDEEFHLSFPLLRLIMLGGLFVYLAMEFAEFSFFFWSLSSHSHSVELILFGPYWWVFWIVHLLFGGVVVIVALFSASRLQWLIGAFLIALTFVSNRLNVLIPGQAVSDLKGLQSAFFHPRLTYVYHATTNEYLIGLFMLAAGVGIFYLGWKLNHCFSDKCKSCEVSQ